MSVRRLAFDERGFIAMAVIAVLTISMLFVGAIVLQVTSTQSSVRRDGSSKRAVEAAQAGINAAMTVAVATAAAPATSWTDSTHACPSRSATGTPSYTSLTYTATSSSPTAWCPASAATAVGAGESYTYQLSAPYTPTGSTNLARDVVATGYVTTGQGAGAGTTAGVTRRLRETIASTTVLTTYNPFATAGVISKSTISVSSRGYIGNASHHVNVAALTGAITDDNGGGFICGVATAPSVPIPTGRASASCGGTTVKQTPSVTIPAAPLPSPTDNATSGLSGYVNWTNNAQWDSAHNTLTINGGGTVTLTGNVISLCAINISGALTLKPRDSTKPIRFYIGYDCPSGTTASLVLNSGSNIYVSYPNGATALLPQVYVKGALQITLNSSTVNQFGVLYAPDSSVHLNGSAILYGDVAANSISVDAGAQILPAAGVQGDISVGSTGNTTYGSSGNLVECPTTGATTTNPGANC